MPATICLRSMIVIGFCLWPKHLQGSFNFRDVGFGREFGREWDEMLAGQGLGLLLCETAPGQTLDEAVSGNCDGLEHDPNARGAAAVSRICDCPRRQILKPLLNCRLSRGFRKV